MSDELHHAELSREVSLAAGSTPNAMVLDGKKMSIAHGQGRPLLERALFFASDFLCCGETVARPLFRAMLGNAQHPMVKQALERVIRDEARHSAFGWQLLDELLERVDVPLRSRLREQIPSYFDRLRRTYAKPELKQGFVPLTEEERAWGLLDRYRYAEITEKCIANTLRPNFHKRDLA